VSVVWFVIEAFGAELGRSEVRPVGVGGFVSLVEQDEANASVPLYWLQVVARAMGVLGDGGALSWGQQCPAWVGCE